MSVRPRHPVLLAALLLALPFLLASRRAGADDQDVEQRKKDLVLHLRIERAIDLGAAWVAATQKADGAFEMPGHGPAGPWRESRHEFGLTALATYTLAHAGWSADRPEVKKALQYLRKHYRSQMKGEYWTQASAYSLSLFVLALHTLFAEEPDANAKRDRERYGAGIEKGRNPCHYPDWAREIIDRVLDWLLEGASKAGLFRYPGGLPDAPRGGPPAGPRGGPAGGPPAGGGPAVADLGDEDMSNTQYVLLALYAGSRCGYEIDKATLGRITKRLLAWQEGHGPSVVRTWDPVPPRTGADARYGNVTRPPRAVDEARGFGYVPGRPPTGSMTAAGLSSLVIVKAIWLERFGGAGEDAPDLDRAIWDAIAWLSDHYSIAQNPPHEGPVWHYYYLYALERACVIAGKKLLGAHDWYREGASMLVDAEKADGHWSPTPFLGSWMRGPSAYSTDLLDTCFAVLFLERAAFRVDVPILPAPTITPSEDGSKPPSPGG